MIIEGNSVAECWLKALQVIAENTGKEISPAILKIHIGTEIPDYVEELEQDLNTFLCGIKQPTICTTAGTIFPESLSHGNVPVYKRFSRIWPLIKKDTKNRNGHYFRRLVAYNEKSGKPVNQLEHIVNTYNQGTGRRSALIATTFDPTLDHTRQRQRGFPCLQQVCFIPHKKNGTLSLNAIYAMQYLSDRAYGNYLGLIRLGEFMANQMGLKLIEVNCIASVLSLGDMTKETARELSKKYN